MDKSERLLISLVIAVCAAYLSIYFSCNFVGQESQKAARISPKQGINTPQHKDKDDMQLAAQSQAVPQYSGSVLPPGSPLLADTDKKIPSLLGMLESSDSGAIYEASGRLYALGKDAVPELVAKLKATSSTALKGQIVFILGRIGDKEAVPELLDIVKDKNAYIRRNAIEALGKIKDARAKGILTASLNDPDATVRGRSAWALGQMGDSRLAADLSRRVRQEKEESVKLAMVNALGKLKNNESTFVLIKELKSRSDQSYKNQVARALGEVGDPQALPDLNEYIAVLKQYKPTESIIIFQIKEAINIAEQAIKKIETKGQIS